MIYFYEIQPQDRKTARPQDRKTDMDYFLQYIAKSLYKEYRGTLNEHCIVLPSRRSCLFFNKYLSAEMDKPEWAPAVMTINDLFRSSSVLRMAEPEILLSELFKIYKKISNSTESFDEFFFWGDMLLNDFDDVDKYLADASKLFRNVSSLKEIDQLFGGLTEEQIRIVQRFWTNFNPERKSNAKEKFKSIWTVLGPLYSDFRDALRSRNLAYEGMIFREAATGSTGFISSKWKMFHFAGFNALNECEKKLMKTLREDAKARFYWDFDKSYTDASGLNSAGHFLRENLRLFGNDMPSGWHYETYVAQVKPHVKRRVIETSSDVAQVKLIDEIISSLSGITSENAHNTAVVLADENLLLPVLTSLPENMEDINITMGYPLRQTSAYLLVRQLLDLQRSAKVVDGNVLFSHPAVAGILKNSLIVELMAEEEKKLQDLLVKQNMILVPETIFSGSALLSVIFIRAASSEAMSHYLKNILLMIAGGEPEKVSDQRIPSAILSEYIYRIILAINRLESITGSPDLSMSVDTWTRLLDRILRTQAVPFSGEPLSGIQIMGILETRTLDFKNLIMLSVNEGIMPAVTTSSSFIPFSLREAFGLPSLNHQESIYAYYFYRLLHRAEDVTFIYNSNPEGLRSGEMSRFLQQMKYDPVSCPGFYNLTFEVKNPLTLGETVFRNPGHNLKLYQRFLTDDQQRILSPSAINTWLSCRMKFYYQYVNNLREPETVVTEIDPRYLGSILHEVMNTIYSGHIGKVIDDFVLKSISADQQSLAMLIRKCVSHVLNRETESYTAINEMMVREVLINYVNRILEIDRIFAPFTLVSLEKQYFFFLDFENDTVRHKVKIGGKPDRIDIKDGVTRIVDYKTGKISDSIDTIEDLFKDDRDKDPDAWLQTLLYCEAYLSEASGAKVRPSVYNIRKVPGGEVSDKLIAGDSTIDDFATIRNEFNKSLSEIIRTIFSKSEPFKMTGKKTAKCGYCPYNILCQRG